MKDPRQITPAEFQIMEALWSRSEAQSVREVLKVIQRDRKVAYTTVMTLLGKLADKGSVVRSRRGKAYFYKPAVQPGETIDFLIQEFADAYLKGDPRRLTQPSPPPKPARSSDHQSPQPDELDIALL